MAGFAALLLLSSLAQSQDWPVTKAEATDYKETSSYGDVVSFLDGLVSAGAPIQVSWIGTSTEGKPIPLVVASRPMVSSAQEAARAGKPVVYVQANIHAGEIEGKEAILQLLRTYCLKDNPMLGDIVLLVNPIYNSDGNDKFGPQARNRPGQDGPEMVGVRANGQGLDLNRDYIKAETPEMRAALAHIWTTWRPDVFMDLHTTDGTRHGYAITYAVPLNPGTPPALTEFGRDTMMPYLRQRFRAEGLETNDYGNIEQRPGAPGWYVVGPEGRYSTNYTGLVGCIGILSESLVYLPFKERVETTKQFVQGVLTYVAENKEDLLDVVKRARVTDRAKPGDSLGVRFEVRSRGKEPVLLEPSPGQGQPRPSGRPKNVQPVEHEVYDRFEPVRSRKVPVAYAFSAEHEAVAKLLSMHGVSVLRALSPASVPAESASTVEFEQDTNAFQGHKLVRLEVKFDQLELKLDSGWYIVPCDQELVPLVFHVLEPESLDGAFAWGFFGESFGVGGSLPVYKLASTTGLVTRKALFPVM